jgi:hypothetical protein
MTADHLSKARILAHKSSHALLFDVLEQQIIVESNSGAAKKIIDQAISIAEEYFKLKPDSRKQNGCRNIALTKPSFQPMRNTWQAIMP